MSRVTQLGKLFDSLAGKWILLRELQSTNAAEPSGFCHGTASFTSREPSPVVKEDGKLDTATAELLYEEQGELEISSAVKFNFSRKYVWRLKAEAETANITVWLTKPGTDKIDYLFHKIDIDANKVTKSERGPMLELEGNGGHLCVEDFYNSSYTFYLAGEKDTNINHLFSSFQTIHEVRGPKKDQVITTQFTRS